MKVYIGPYKKSGGERTIRVQIHDYDTFSMDVTLAHIITPMLKKLRDDKCGAPYVDNEDVPDNLRCYANDPSPDVDENHFARWDYVLNEMIFAFESKLTDWEDQFHSGECDFEWKQLDSSLDDTDGEHYRLHHGPNHTHVFDEEGWRAMNSRIENGFRLFGKYYSGLWT